MVQEHDKFKLFSAQYAANAGLDPLLREIEAWVKTTKIAPKSIGVEYLEGSRRLIMSIGYRDDESYPITLQQARMGKIDASNDFGKIEKEIAAFVSKLRNVICHELFVTETGDLNMVFMCKSNP
jgi:hypothetical protein